MRQAHPSREYNGAPPWAAKTPKMPRTPDAPPRPRTRRSLRHGWGAVDRLPTPLLRQLATRTWSFPMACRRSAPPPVVQHQKNRPNKHPGGYSDARFAWQARLGCGYDVMHPSCTRTQRRLDPPGVHDRDRRRGWAFLSGPSLELVARCPLAGRQAMVVGHSRAPRHSSGPGKGARAQVEVKR